MVQGTPALRATSLVWDNSATRKTAPLTNMLSGQKPVLFIGSLRETANLEEELAVWARVQSETV